MKKSKSAKPNTSYLNCNPLRVQFVLEWRGKRTERVVFDPVGNAFFLLRTDGGRMFKSARQVAVPEIFRWLEKHKDATRYGGFADLLSQRTAVKA